MSMELTYKNRVVNMRERKDGPLVKKKKRVFKKKQRNMKAFIQEIVL
jgi:hypothetical protein